MNKIFISYARHDRTMAEKVERALSRAGFSTWSDKDIALGTDSMRAIDDAIGAADAFIVLLSRSFLTSEYCYAELGSIVAKALADRSRIVPVYIDDTVTPEQVPAVISSRHVIRVPSDMPSDQSLSEVVKAIDG